MNKVSADQNALNLFGVTLDGVFAAAHEAIVLIDAGQTVVAINPAAQRLLACTAQEALGTSITRFIPQPHRQAHGLHVEQFAASNATGRAMANRRPVLVHRANGETIPVEIMLSRVDGHSASGAEQHYFAALLRDLSSEQTLRDNIQALEGRLRAVFDLGPLALWIAADDRVVFANRAAGRLFGVADGAALQGLSIFALLHTASHAPLRQSIQRALDGETELPPVLGQLANDKGEVREVEIAVAALPDHGHTTVQMVVADVTQRRREALENEHARRGLRQLTANAVQAREAERRRIARELHDELGQRLTALKMGLSSLGSAIRGSRNQAQLSEMLGMLDDTVAAVRRISGDLRPLMLDDLGLNAAIEWLAANAAKRLGITIDVELMDITPPPAEPVAITLYRMVQEALTNVGRHARATRVWVELRHEGGELVLSVRDDGVGFAEPSLRREGSYGLLGMRERALMFGGRLEVANAPGGGGRVTVHLPFAPLASAPPPVPVQMPAPAPDLPGRDTP